MVKLSKLSTITKIGNCPTKILCSTQKREIEVKIDVLIDDETFPSRYAL